MDANPAACVVVGLVVVLVVRPITGLLGLLGTGLAGPSRAVIATFGIRAIGSFYYLASALNQFSFRQIELLVASQRLWALLGFIVLTSIVLYGVTASSVMDPIEQSETSGSPTES